MSNEELEDFVVTRVPPNFIYPEIKEEVYKFGSGQLTGTPLRGDGDWRDYLPPTEDQNVGGIESSACYIEASQHTIATIEEEQFGEIDNNYSARFNALLSDGTPSGGDPLKGGDSMRHDGLVPNSLMPFGETIKSWSDFHSWKDVVESVVRAAGKKYLERKILGYDLVCQKRDSVESKYKKLRRALQYSPCPMSVAAWYERDGIYYKPRGIDDNHLVELVYIDEFNRPHIRDTYAPYEKILEPNYDMDFAMRWSVEKKSVLETLPQWQKLPLFNWLVDLLKWIHSDKKKPMPEVPLEIVPEPPKVPKENLLDTMCLAIRDHEGWKMNPPSRSFRNKNPGNLRYVGQALAIGKDDKNFAIFATVEDGFKTLKNMILNAARGKSTVYKPDFNLRAFFGVYAPDTDGNDSVIYSNYVAKRMGVDVITWKIKELA